MLLRGWNNALYILCIASDLKMNIGETMKLKRIVAMYLLLGLFGYQIFPAAFMAYGASDEDTDFAALTAELVAVHPGKSGLYVLEKGEEALLARAWLTDHASSSVDVQYFIWSTDNIGILAAESLLRAADRGVAVRVLVDDLLIDAPDQVMVALNGHPLIEVKIYNPKHSVGTTTLQRLFNIASQFKSVNQRMHDKTFAVDKQIAITGGRNMADEYFDYDHTYNFRDRDILLIGPIVSRVNSNFEVFWNSEYAVALTSLLDEKIISSQERQKVYEDLHRYAENPDNFNLDVRQSLDAMPLKFKALEENLTWADAHFTHDVPGKNSVDGLSGGGRTTDDLIRVLAGAKESILIQSPYLVMPQGGIELFRKLVEQGVEVRISTNSLASTDNLQAFSGYLKQRKKILQAGIQVYEYKPSPQVQQKLIERYSKIEKQTPTFAIHAKSMVVDHEHLFVGTFNLDPRSANLNTEVGVLISDKGLAARVEQAIAVDIAPENSWDSARENPNQYAPLNKRLKVWFWRMMPLEPIL